MAQSRPAERLGGFLLNIPMKTEIRAKLTSNIVGPDYEIKRGEVVTGKLAVDMLQAGMAEVVAEERDYEKAVLTRPKKAV